MCAAALQSSITLSKFRGCMIGALLGDCLGSAFEDDEKVSQIVLQKYFDKMEGPEFKSPLKMYTDDTVMTTSVAESLIHHGSFHEKDMAKRFISEYFHQPRRGYGSHVTTVFHKLKSNKLEDVWGPAKEQFQGQGSAGNGGAMRISPIGLFCHNNQDLLIETAAKCTKLTHTHCDGVNGAILQALAVQKCFLQDASKPIEGEKFVTELLDTVAVLEPEDELITQNEEEPRTYKTQLNHVLNMLEKDVDVNEVVNVLGHDVLALYSVPTAIYCLLRSQRPIDKIKTENSFRRCLQYSISLGGDTDTIASMAGALSGAHLGIEAINDRLKNHCEGVDYVNQLASELHSVAFDK